MKHTSTHRFQRGQRLHLDDIYTIQGLGDGIAGIGRWWDRDEEDSDEIVVTKDLSITITIRTPNNSITGGEAVP